MMPLLSAAILGAGNIAGGFDQRRKSGDNGIYSHAGAYLAHGGFEIQTVFDLSAERANAFRNYWKISKVAPDFDQILCQYHDVISVCTPDETHYACLKSLLNARCCRTIFVEKPLAFSLMEISEIAELADNQGINVVINYQRRHEPVHTALKRRIAANPSALVSVSAHYMKGLQHIGVTMIDTLCHLCGYPEAVMSYARAASPMPGDSSYEFILYYPFFTASVKTTDAERFNYNYHLFELDFLFADGRSTLVDISQGVKQTPITDYAYSGVRVMNEKLSTYADTDYRHSMPSVVNYVHEVTTGKRLHDTNTPNASFNNALVVNRIIESYDKGLIKLDLDKKSWKN